MPQTPEQIKKKAGKVVDNQGSVPLAQLDATIEITDKLDDVVKAIKAIPEVEIPETKFPTSIEAVFKGISTITLKGDTGEQGERGLQGLKGDQGKTGKDGKNGKDGKKGLDGLQGEQGIQGEKGDNGSPDTREDIIIKINSGTDKDLKIQAKFISDLPQFTREIVREVGAHGGAYETPIKSASTGVIFPKDASGAWLISSVGGTGPTLQTNGVNNGSQALLNLKAGTNVTLTDNGSGQVTIDSTGGSGGSVTPYAETPGGTVNGSNVTFTLAHTPAAALGVIVELDGVVQRNGAGLDFTVSGSTITFATAPATGSEIFSYYNTSSASGTSPVIISTTTGINAKSVANTLAYTNTTGNTIIVTSATIRCTAASSITNGPTIGIGTAAGTSDIFAPANIAALTTTTTIYGFVLVGMSVKVPNGGTIYINVTAAATGTSQIVSADILAYSI